MAVEHVADSVHYNLGCIAAHSAAGNPVPGGNTVPPAAAVAAAVAAAAAAVAG